MKIRETYMSSDLMTLKLPGDAQVMKATPCGNGTLRITYLSEHDIMSNQAKLVPIPVAVVPVGGTVPDSLVPFFATALPIEPNRFLFVGKPY